MFKAVKGSKLYEQVLRQIKTQIMQGRYQKGDMLPSEKELMQSTGVSRITVREALKMLASSGIIETRQGKGSFVLIDGRELMQQTEDKDRLDDFKVNFRYSIDTRLIMEPEIAREVAGLAGEIRLERIRRHLKMTGAEEEGASIGQAGLFHRSIVEALHNPLLLEMFDKLVDVEINPPMTSIIPPHKQKEMRLEFERQHAKIYDAIASGNGEFAYFYMKEHTLYVSEAYEKYFTYFFED